MYSASNSYIPRNLILLALLYVLCKLKVWKLISLCFKPCNQYVNCFNTGGTHVYNENVTTPSPQYSVRFTSKPQNEQAFTVEEVSDEPVPIYVKPSKRKTVLKPIL
ncbi:uncharacterized protein LOC143364222 [Halictus rubicundus]|uniref:uncharacterized protein LOC143357313 n=1 Tax=Halictus rubicundus TaxID=77578 RepID=UPI0040355450